jgi:hypothetical protein
MTKLRLVLIALLAGCGGDRAQIAGDATYADASAMAAGQTTSVMVIMTGTGSIPYPDPDCSTDTPGAWQAIFNADADVADNGAYAASLEWMELTQPTGCKLSALDAAVVTGIDIHAEIPSTVDSCHTYCDAKTRADGNISGWETCQNKCTTQSRAIAADVSIGTGGIGQLDASLVREAAFHNLSASLTFDHLQQ